MIPPQQRYYITISLDLHRAYFLCPFSERNDPMAKAKKLPSGSWRVLVYSHSEPVYDDNGKPILDKAGKPKQKRFYESFTSDDPSTAGKREAEYAAAEFALNKKNKSNITKNIWKCS